MGVAQLAGDESRLQRSSRIQSTLILRKLSYEKSTFLKLSGWLRASSHLKTFYFQKATLGGLGIRNPHLRWWKQIHARYDVALEKKSGYANSCVLSCLVPLVGVR